MALKRFGAAWNLRKDKNPGVITSHSVEQTIPIVPNFSANDCKKKKVIIIKSNLSHINAMHSPLSSYCSVDR